MEFTGERVIPGEVDPDLWNEHLSRYAFAARFAKLLLGGRRAAPNGSVQTTAVPGATAAGGSPASAVLRVLDAGCGSGYGTAHLASLDPTLQVVGIDHNEEALAYARAHYAGPNLRFARGDCMALEFPDGEFDLVVAFEVLEHLSEPTKFLEQVRRVLRPSGHLLVSTPNRRYYSEERGYVNPFHTREYDASEFDALLAGFFPERVIFAQNHAPAIVSFPCGGTTPCSREYGSKGAVQFDASPEAADQPHFLVAVCSQQMGTVPEPFVFVPSAGNVLRERDLDMRRQARELDERKRWAEQLNAELERARHLLEQRKQQLEERTAWARSQESELERAREALSKLQQEFEERTAWARSLESELERAREALSKLQQEFEERTAWARSLESELERAREALSKLQQEFEERTAWALKLDAELRLLSGSRWYRLGRKLQLSPVPPSDQKQGGGA